MHGNRFRQFIWNGLLLTAVSFFMRAVGVAFQLFVSREAGSEALGLYSVIGGVYGFLVTLATSGIQLGTTRMISEALGKDDDAEVRGARRVCFLYALAFGTLATLILFFGAGVLGQYLLKDARTVRSLRILSLSLLPVALSAVCNGYFTAVRRVYKNALTGILEQGLRISVTAMLLLYIFPHGIETACIALVIGSVVCEAFSALILGILCMREKKRFTAHPYAPPPAGLMRKLCGISLPVAFSAYARSGLLTLEHLLIPIGLTVFFGDRATALSSFGILRGVVFPILLFPSAVIGSYAGLLVPEIAECRIRNQRARLSRIVETMFRLTLIFAIGASGIMLFFSHTLGAHFGNGDESALYLRMLAPLVPVMYLDTASDAILKGHGEQVFCMRVNLLDSLLSVVLVYLLLPGMGMQGYILILYVAEIMNAACGIVRLLRITGMKPVLLSILYRPVLAIIGATTIMHLSAAGAGISFAGSKSAMFSGMAITVVLYLLLLFLLEGGKRSSIVILTRSRNPKTALSDAMSSP